MFKKSSKRPQIAEREALEVMFHRLAAHAQSLYLHFKDKTRCPVLGLEGASLFVAMTAAERERQGVRLKQNVKISLYYEGKECYGGARVLGAGRFDEREALRLSLPGAMTLNDDFCLTYFHLMPRKEVVFTSTMNQLCTGALVNIGIKGVDIKSKESQPIKELLAIDRETQLGFELEKGLHFAVKGRVLYVQNLEEQLIGIEFLDADRDLEAKLNQWIAEQTQVKQDKDRRFLEARKKGGGRRAAEAASASTGDEAVAEGAAEVGSGEPSVRDDFQPVLREGNPKVLVLSKDEALIERLGKCLMRKYGVLRSKGRFANVKELIAHYRPGMILIHERLGMVSGFDLAQTILSHADEERFIMIMGDGENEVEKSNQAVRAGAIDYLVVEPFKTLPVFKKIDELILEEPD